MAQQQIRKWGNSPAIRIPAAVMAAANLEVDQSVRITAQEGRVIIEPSLPRLSLRKLVSRITPGNRHSEVDFGAPVGREVA